MPDILKRLFGLQNVKYTHQKWLNVICRIIIIIYTVNTFCSFIDNGVFGIIIAAIRSAIVAIICITVFTIIKSVITNRIKEKETDKLKKNAPAEMLGMFEMDKNRIEIQRLRRNIAITTALMLLSSYIAFWMLMIYSEDYIYYEVNEFLIIGALILVVTPFIIALRIMGKKKGALDEKYKEFFEKSVINKILESVFELNEFERGKCIDKKIINALNIFPYFERYNGEDYLSARYKGVEFVQSDVYLSKDEERVRTDKKGNTRIEIVNVTVFRGRLVIVDYDAISNEPVYVHDKKIKKIKTIAETEIGSFNDSFAVEADSALSAMRILTPQVLEGILTASNKLNCSMSMAFKDDKIYIAINSGDSFVSENYGESIFQHEERIKNDVQIIFDLVDSIYLK